MVKREAGNLICARIVAIDGENIAVEISIMRSITKNGC